MTTTPKLTRIYIRNQFILMRDWAAGLLDTERNEPGFKLDAFQKEYLDSFKGAADTARDDIENWKLVGDPSEDPSDDDVFGDEFVYMMVDRWRRKAYRVLANSITMGHGAAIHTLYDQATSKAHFDLAECISQIPYHGSWQPLTFSVPKQL